MKVSRLLVAGTLTAVLALAGGAAGQAQQPPAKCKTVSVVESSQTRAVTRDTATGDQTGTQTRTVTTTTERCRGDLQTNVTYGKWSAPTYAY